VLKKETDREVAFSYTTRRDVALGGSPRASGLASGLALAVRPGGWAEAPPARVGPEDAFCGAVRKDLRVPLRVEGPTRTMCGVPARWL
jgi:hypothetical protein